MVDGEVRQKIINPLEMKMESNSNIVQLVGPDEIRQQRNSKEMKKYLEEWNKELSAMNTLNRNKVLKQLNFSINDHDLIGQSTLLDPNNLNLGQVYVPMMDDDEEQKFAGIEESLADSDALTSIDLVIFKPKRVSTERELIKEAEGEIDQQFQYLNDVGLDKSWNSKHQSGGGQKITWKELAGLKLKSKQNPMESHKSEMKVDENMHLLTTRAVSWDSDHTKNKHQVDSDSNSTFDTSDQQSFYEMLTFDTSSAEIDLKEDEEDVKNQFEVDAIVLESAKIKVADLHL